MAADGVSAKSVKMCLTKSFQKAYGTGRPQPWQEEAIVQAALGWKVKLVRLFDHPRGLGKTKEIAMMTHVALQKLGARLVLLISDRKDLEAQLHSTAKEFLEKNGYSSTMVESCSRSSRLENIIQRLEEDPSQRAVVSVTLQSFPHVTLQLSAGLRDATAALADEAHRSHADKSLSEELARVLGGPVHFLLYTGTASDRCLRLFGERERRKSDDGDDLEICRPFHSVSEREVADRSMIFELERLQRRCVELKVGLGKVEAEAKRLGFKTPVLQALRARATTSRAESVVMLKAAYFMREFAAMREELHGKFEPQMMIVTSSRRAVMEYVEACRTVASQTGEATLTIYGAFSNKLGVAAAGGEAEEKREVDELAYNRELVKLHGQDAHRHAHILVVCDRFETGYDNSAIILVAVDKKVTSLEKLVQIYSRGNRRRQGKPAPLVIDVQNPSKDIERAVGEYSVPRVCLASDGGEAVMELSEKLRQMLGDLADSKTMEETEAAFAAWTPEARGKLAGLLAPYLRRRCEGVSRTVAGNLLSVKQATMVWKVLIEKHKCDVAPMAQKLRAIADLAASRSCNLLTSSFVDSGAGALVVTPTKGLRPGEGQEVTPPKLQQPTLEQLSELHAKMLDEEFIVDAEARSGGSGKRSLAEDVRTLSRSKGHGRRRTFECLQRVALAACDERKHEVLLKSGAAEALLGIFLNGDRIEQPWAWKGLAGLAPASERLKKIAACREHTQLLSDAATVKQKEVGALKAIASSLCAWRAAVVEGEALDAKILEAKEELAALRSKALNVSDFMPPVPSDSKHWYVDHKGTVQRKTAKIYAQEERERRREAQRKFGEARESQKSELKALRTKLQSLETGRAAVTNDFEAVRLLSVPQTLERLPELCRGRLRAQARKATLAIWRAMSKLDGEWLQRGSAAECAELVESAKRIRCQARGQQKLLGVAPALRALPEAVLQQLASLGIVDDLLMITAGVQASPAAVDCLRALAAVAPKAAGRADLFGECLKKAGADSQGADAGSQALLRMRTLVARPRASRKRPAADGATASAAKLARRTPVAAPPCPDASDADGMFD